MKWNYRLTVLLLAAFLATATAKDSHKKEGNLSKQKLEKLNHRQSSLGHWDVGSMGSIHGKQKSEHHHAVKEVQKHAPLSVSQQEAHMQLDLGHMKKKASGLHHQGASSRSEMNLQDLAHEEQIKHKMQSHKIRAKHGSEALDGSGKRNVGHGKASGDKRKSPKKVLLNKNKKNKRAKRLHKQFLF